MKRWIAALLSFCILLGCVPTAFGTENAATNDTSIDTGAVSMEADNALGKLVTQSIEDTQDAATGYAISDLQITDGIATVAYGTLEDATVVVAIYTEDQQQLLGSSHAPVSREERTISLPLEMEMPEYFYASAYLVDNYDMSPLCPAFDTPMYTRQMQELLASTANDYDSSLVLNLDSSDSTNFAVYNESTSIVPYTEGVNQVLSADEDSRTYIIGNADHYFTQAQPGQILSYSYGPDAMLIVKVASVTVDGSTVTLTGADMEIEEVFSHVKIEGAAGSQGLTIDESTADEGVSYISRPPVRDMSGQGSGSFSHVFGLGLEIEVFPGDITTSVTVDGTIAIQADTEFSYYIAFTQQYVHYHADIETDYTLTVGGEVSIDMLKLPAMGFSPAPGLFIGFEPTVNLTFSGAVSFSTVHRFALAFSFTLKNGLQNNSTAPVVTHEDKSFTGNAFVSINMNPHAKVGDADILSFSFSIPVGVRLTGTLTGSDYQQPTEQSPSKHGCKKCIAVSFDFVCKADIKMKILRVTFTLPIGETTKPLRQYYYSMDSATFGDGECPNITYRVTLSAKDRFNKPVANAEIFLDKTIVLGRTNSNGVLVSYVNKGQHSFTAVLNDSPVTVTQDIESACKVSLSTDSAAASILNGMIPADSILDITPIASGSCGDNARWYLYGSGELQITGTGYIQNFNDNNPSPWLPYQNRITAVYVDEGITGLPDGAFSGYTAIEKVILPNSLTTFGRSVFSGCTGLTQIKLPVTHTLSIWGPPFEGCTNVRSIHYTYGQTGIMPDRYDNSNMGSYYQSALEYICRNTLESVYFDDGITGIGNYAFFECRNLSSLRLPNSLTAIGAHAFQNCVSLTQMPLSENVGTFGTDSFSGCSGLTQIQIPAKVTRLPDGCFAGCSGLTELTIPDTVTNIGRYAFVNCSGLRELTIPVECSVGYNLFDGVCNVSKIRYTYGQTGVMPDRYDNSNYGHYYQNSLEYASRNSLQSVSFSEGITYIGNYCFRDCAVLSQVTLPETLESIGRSGFAGCASLKQLPTGQSLTSLGSDAFSGCGITSLSLPESIKEIGSGCFSGCSSLTSLQLPATLTSIPDGCFNGCSGLVNLVIPDTVTFIGSHAFSNCSGLRQVTLPVDYTHGTIPFSNTSNVERIHFTSGQTGIMHDRYSSSAYSTHYENTLEYNSRGSLQTVSFSEGITHLGNYSLYDCYRLTEIYFAGDAPTFGYDVCSYVTATAYYPAGNPSWENISDRSCGGTITWTATEVSAKRPATRAVFGGEYGTEQEEDDVIVKTADFSGLVPGEQYIMLSLISMETKDLLAADNILAIRQAQAAEDGTVSFRYIQRVYAQSAYVFACGASDKHLKDAVITMPALYADTEISAVTPEVSYKGQLLTEGKDYVLTGAVDYSGAGEYVCYIRGINLYTGLVQCAYTVTAKPIAQVVTVDSSTSYTSFAGAVAAAQSMQNSYVRLLADAEETYCVTGELWLDLNGCQLSGITVSGTLYGMDSATDDYTDTKAGALTCTLTDQGQVIPHHKHQLSGSIKRYMTVENGSSFSFHRFYLGITKLSLSTAAAGFGYKALFAGSDTVKSQLDSFGYRLWIQGKPVVSKSMAMQCLPASQEITLLLKNILSANKDLQTNIKNAQTDIHAQVFLKCKDGTTITGSEHVYSLRAMMETLNLRFDSLSDSQKAALKKLAQDYSDVMTQWSIENIQ